MKLSYFFSWCGEQTNSIVLGIDWDPLPTLDSSFCYSHYLEKASFPVTKVYLQSQLAALSLIDVKKFINNKLNFSL